MAIIGKSGSGKSTLLRILATLDTPDQGDVLLDGNAEAIEDNTLTVHISRIRRKIGLEYIETIRGFGYRLVKPE